VLSALVDGAVTQVHDSEIRIVRQLENQRAMMGGDVDVTDEATLAKSSSGIHYPARRLFVPEAQQQHIGVLKIQFSQGDFNARPGERRRS
jgi:hypothetical protein